VGIEEEQGSRIEHNTYAVSQVHPDDARNASGEGLYGAVPPDGHMCFGADGLDSTHDSGYAISAKPHMFGPNA
jgi:hypothetical protein